MDDCNSMLTKNIYFEKRCIFNISENVQENQSSRVCVFGRITHFLQVQSTAVCVTSNTSGHIMLVRASRHIDICTDLKWIKVEKIFS